MTVVVAVLVTTLQKEPSADPSWIFACVLLAGAFQLVLGLLRVGRYINYVPYPVVSGFMSGIGIIITPAAPEPVFAGSGRPTA